MRHFITSDIHSYYSVLKQELEKQGFDKEKDTLITLGDNFDRGKQPFEMYHLLTTLPHVITIRGNHEDLLVDMIERGYPEQHDVSNGTKNTVLALARHYNDGYPGYIGDAIQVIKASSFYKWLTGDGWKDEIIFGNFVLTHASIKDNAYNGEWKEARWVNPYFNRVPNKVLICGHWHAYAGRLYSTAIQDDVDDMYKPYIDKDLIMLDACTALTHRCNVLIYDDVDGNLYYDGKVIANSNNEIN